MTTILSLAVLSPFGAAQTRDRSQQGKSGSDSNQSRINTKKNKRGPRAIAVLEFLPGGGARLVPVALWIDDHFYDASLYGADPEPMALEPETVYEATNYGEPTGLFTVTSPEQVKGAWIATGQWKPHSDFDDRKAQQPAKQQKPPQGSSPLDDRPVLRRPGSSNSSSSDASKAPDAPASGGGNSPAGNAPPTSNEPPDRPTLKKPSSEAPAPIASPQPSPAAANASASSSPARSPDENDPNRPILRRGSPASIVERSTAKPTGNSPAPAEATPASVVEGGSVARHSYPAVSDAGKYETRSLLYAMSPAERESKTEQMSSLSLDEIKKFIAKRNTPGLPKNARISDYDLRAFDLDYSNSPTFVFMATLPVPGAKAFRRPEFDYYVTLVAREDINGTPIVIFTSVTDSNHLDAFSRMEIIDAVDADANGRGDLLFREYSDVGISYGLYRIYPYEMRKVFEGGASM
ncbi:MAG TPA: hypothetical protein VKB58_01925 [Terriglobales bacterium]|jgi:hypothetical protein|nr:hypothetical protein [Terriglobales bacterium]